MKQLMYQLAICSVVMLSSATAYAHEYFFAFAEMEYKQETNQFEITLEGSAHDVEDVMNASGITIKELEDHYTDSVMLRKIETFINDGLKISSGVFSTSLELIGYEVKNDGMVNFYLKSKPISVQASIQIEFPWLMDHMEQQQNKVILNYQSKKYTAVYLQQKRVQTITL